MKLRIWLSLAALLVLSGGIAACGSTPPAASTSQPGAGCKSAPSTITIATLPTLSYATTFYAYSLGYLKKAAQTVGATVKIEQVGAITSEDAALASGSAQFEEDVVQDIMAANYAGQQFRVVAALAPGQGGLLVAKPNIKSVLQLQGGTVALSSLSSLGVVQVKKAVQQAGGNPNAVKFVALGSLAAANAALQRGTVDAVGVGQPYAAEAVHGGFGHVLLDFNEAATGQKIFGTPYVSSSLVTTASLIKSCPKVVQAVVRAYYQAAQWVAAHKSSPAAGLAALPSEFQTTKPYFSEIWPDITASSSTNFGISSAALNAVVKVTKELGVLPSSYTLTESSLVDQQFWNEIKAS